MPSHHPPNDAFVRALSPGQNPLGRIVQDADGAPLEAVGIAADVKSQHLGMLDGPSMYRLRDPRTYGDAILIRFDGDAAPVRSAVQSLLHTMEPGMLPRIGTLQSSVDNLMDSFWKVLEIVLFLGVIAIGLAVIGIHGVVAFSVSRRGKEMGIRAALGATRRDIVVSVITSGVRPISFGLLAGMLISICAAALLEQVLRATPIAIDVKNPIPYLIVALLLATTALLAMLGPALRAARCEPLSALRQE